MWIFYLKNMGVKKANYFKNGCEEGKKILILGVKKAELFWKEKCNKQTNLIVAVSRIFF